MSQKLGVEQLWGIILAGGEGIRVRPFLSQLCGGRGIKQFCAVIGQRSMLEHTLARVEMLIPRQRILVIVSQDHHEEAAQQLRHWPTENIIVQPNNRETTAGILLPLTYIAHRDPNALVAIFPSDHFILQEQQFISFVERAVWETHWFPQSFTLLGMTPDRLEDGYGWIECGPKSSDWLTRPVAHFWEKPSMVQANALWQQGALWNSFVGVTQCTTLWQMVQEAVPDLYLDFLQIFRALGTAQEEKVIHQIYRRLRPVNFSSDVCEPRTSMLRVLPVPNIGWSDWGSVKRIMDTVDELGKKTEVLARLNHQQYAWNSMALPT